ncbi:hypothetical protein [Parachlamydia acanthamoebae]|uniref:hypothetical protein n=1 Tax=Parachlamydia acanthamoebae TaxID=83552 RepID=UPI0024E1D0EE|nr:hypothetical protein [Parachlamydia acanthamoebae]
MSISSLNVYLHQNKSAEKLLNSSGKSKNRIEFTDAGGSTRYFIAYDSIITSNVAKPPKLGFFEKRRFVLLKTNDNEYVKINKNSLLKRFGVSKQAFAAQEKLSEDLTQFISSQIAKVVAIEETFGVLSPRQIANLKSDYEKLELKDGSVFLGHHKNKELLSGYGFIKDLNGEIFEGTFKRGLAHGRGKLTSPGGIYEYTFKNDDKYGKAKATLNDGSVFVAKFKKDRLIQAVMTAHKGKKVKNVFHARVQKDGETYHLQNKGYNAFFKGTFDKWGRPIEGEIVCPKDGQFKGKFKDLMPDRGALQFVNGPIQTFAGEFEDTQPRRGTLFFKDGFNYTGDITSEALGGKITLLDGVRYVACSDQEKNFQGTFEYPNGSKFTGRFEHQYPLEGKMEYPEDHDIVEFVGTFECDVPKHGTIIFRDGLKFTGEITEEILNRKV